MLTSWPPFRVAAVRHATDGRGRPILLARRNDPLAEEVTRGPYGYPTCVLEVTHVAPIALHPRIRGKLRLSGFLTMVGTHEVAPARRALADHHPLDALGYQAVLLRLDVVEVTVKTSAGSQLVRPLDYARAAVDPLAPYEAALLGHLDSCHPSELAAAARRLQRLTGLKELGRPETMQARPLRLDRYGLDLRLIGEHDNQDTRLFFPQPLSCPKQAGPAVTAALTRSPLDQVKPGC